MNRKLSRIKYEAIHYALVEAIVALSRRLKLTFVAEGVEPARKSAFSSNCDQGQGNLFCEPLPVAQFEARNLR